MDPEIRLLDQSELPSILPLIQTLNPTVEWIELQRRLQEMIGQGYQCAGAWLDGHLVAICGMWITTRFYSGKQIEPDNVIVDLRFRDRGLGRRLMAWVYDYGREIGCLSCELNAYTSNHGAHRFYIREGFVILGYHFCHRLDHVSSP